MCLLGDYFCLLLNLQPEKDGVEDGDDQEGDDGAEKQAAHDGDCARGEHAVG